MTFRLFGTRPRCVECGTHDNLHQVEDGIHKAWVCTEHAITTGYVNFLPSLAEEIRREMEEIHEGNYAGPTERPTAPRRRRTQARAEAEAD